MPERWEAVERLFHEAMQRSERERSAFLAKACDGDVDLQHEVESLIEQSTTGTSGLADAVLARRRIPSPATSCPSCKSAVDPSDQFCRACGSPVVVTGRAEEERLRAGSLFAGRFRIAGELGRGGMGAVYRAHDLKLDQTVALKFLNIRRLHDLGNAQARLRAEVRLARQIAHPNVCRVYDLGEADGDLYVSMEYVDGEDLAALLRRIGRLPMDKAIEVARKLCAGLAAAHAKNVLHRDLKPRNIMIDGEGGVRIMDFGLAVIADELNPDDVRSGTPAYMAPEQLAGREATRQSDLYALGLILYEIFTGRVPFQAKSASELLRLRETSPVTPPSGLVGGMSPALDRAILQCLDPNPRMRPASALDLAAALPGGDPLAEALAAGVTPSPRIVAAAGGTEALHPKFAVALLLCIAGGLMVVGVLTPHVQLVGQLPLENPPEVLSSKARDIARALGHSERPSDAASGFRYDDLQMQYTRRMLAGSGAQRKEQWSRVLSAPPHPVSFWYRYGPTPLIPRPQEPLSWAPVAAPVLISNTSRMVAVDVDLEGRLLRFAASAPEGSRPDSREAADWPGLFAAADLDISQFSPVDPQAQFSGVSDAQRAWNGMYPNVAEPVRIEAASFRGSVVYFEIFFPWARLSSAPAGSAVESKAPWEDLLLLALLAGIAVIARHNWKAGRGDLRGAWRLALYTAIAYAVSLFLTAQPGTLPRAIWLPIAFSISFGLVVAATYLAVEPWVRRMWPHALITWTRVLSGQWRDSVVGRDLLVAFTCAVLNHGLQRAAQFVAIELGSAPAGPISAAETFGFYLGNLAGTRLMLADTVIAFVRCLDVLLFFFVVFLARVLLKKQWRATIVYLVFWHAVLSAPYIRAGDWVVVIYWMVELSLLLFLMLRFGLLAAVAFGAISLLVSRGMLTTDLGAWYGQSSLVTVAIVTALAIVAFRLSLGGRPLWPISDSVA